MARNKKEVSVSDASFFLFNSQKAEVRSLKLDEVTDFVKG